MSLRVSLCAALPRRHNLATHYRFSTSIRASSSSDVSTSTPSSEASGSNSSSTVIEADEEGVDSLSPREEARQRAWYLDDEPSKPTKPHGFGLSTTHSPHTSDTSETAPRQPKFTTFDPSRTTSDLPSDAVIPFPADGPSSLKPLYEWMVSDAGGAEVLDITSVRLYNTREAPWWTVGSGELVKDPEVASGRVGATWEWNVVGVVKGTGKGVVRRAEKAIRLWLHKNPIGKVDSVKQTVPGRPKLPRVPEETDWSLIGIPGLRTSINLFTAEGKERWDLDDLWTGRRKKNTSFGQRFVRGEEDLD